MIDPNSVNYQPYLDECEELRKWQDEEYQRILAQYPLDGTKNLSRERTIGHLHKETGRRLKELQIKYGYREKLP